MSRSAPIDGHRCAAWCTGSTHVDLGHWDGAHWTDDEVSTRWQADYDRRGVRIEVDRIEPAPEAPDRPHGTAWLVWWRLAG